jgi:hypothetical protein
MHQPRPPCRSPDAAQFANTVDPGRLAECTHDRIQTSLRLSCIAADGLHAAPSFLKRRCPGVTQFSACARYQLLLRVCAAEGDDPGRSTIRQGRCVPKTRACWRVAQVRKRSPCARPVGQVERSLADRPYWRSSSAVQSARRPRPNGRLSCHARARPPVLSKSADSRRVFAGHAPLPTRTVSSRHAPL